LMGTKVNPQQKKLSPAKVVMGPSKNEHFEEFAPAKDVPSNFVPSKFVPSKFVVSLLAL
jgi:hypothetical protein